MESQVLAADEKPFLDADAFQQLLAAAYVIQQQNDLEQLEPAPQRVAAPISTPTPDPEETLTIIAETQELLRSLPYDRTAAANLIAERLQKITGANGVAIAVEREGRLEYCAALGTAADLAGASVPMSDTPVATGDKASAEGPFSAATGPANFDHNTISLPLRHEGKIAGILEVHFDHPEAIHEREVRSCQLMAGLMTEALARAADMEWKRALSSERATMLEALGRIMPQLERLAIEPSGDAKPGGRKQPAAKPPRILEELAISHPAPAPQPAVPSKQLDSDPVIEVCQACGYQFGATEKFCGRCGKPRPGGTPPSASGSSDLDSALRLQTPDDPEADKTGSSDHEMSDLGFISDEQLASLVGIIPDKPRIEEQSETASAIEFLPLDDEADHVEKPEASEDLPVVPEVKPHASPWASSVKARNWLESLRTETPAGIWLSKQRGNLYVAVAVTLLVVAIMGWGLRTPDLPQTASKSPQPSMSLFDKLLVDLDLAQPPVAPVYNGNPNTQVWVDLHTALYYCPGSDLFGKTPGGKISTQRDAQIDQFEPAQGKTCN